MATIQTTSPEWHCYLASRCCSLFPLAVIDPARTFDRTDFVNTVYGGYKLSCWHCTYCSLLVTFIKKLIKKICTSFKITWPQFRQHLNDILTWLQLYNDRFHWKMTAFCWPHCVDSSRNISMSMFVQVCP